MLLWSCLDAEQTSDVLVIRSDIGAYFSFSLEAVWAFQWLNCIYHRGMPYDFQDMSLMQKIIPMGCECGLNPTMFLNRGAL